MNRPRALVIGGSLGGLLAAHLLRDVGWDAVVYERNAEDLTSRGAGIGTHAQLLEILRRIDIPFDESMGVKVDTVVCLDHSGQTILQHPTVRTMSAWARLYCALRDALPPGDYRLGRTLDRVEQDADGVTAIFADGTRERGDFLVGADGIRSTVRAQVLPDAQPLYAGYVAWRAMLDEWDLPPDIHTEIFERYAFCLPEGEQLLGYPVPGRNNDTTAGRRAYNIVWYRPVQPEPDLVALCTDAAGHHHAGGIPPPLIRPEAIAAIKATAQAVLAPQLAEIFVRSQPFFQPIFDLESPQITFGRVALLGDAAFVARPHVGAGVTKASVDAASLADALAAEPDIAAALARYQQEQTRFGRGLVALGREHGAYLSAQLKPPGERSEAERYRDIDSVIFSHSSGRARVRELVAEGRPA